MNLIGTAITAVVVTITLYYICNSDWTPSGTDNDEDDYHINW